MAIWDKNTGDITKSVLKYQGVYDFERLMREMHAWLKNKGYFIKYKDQTEERKPQGVLFRFEWICDRQPTPYYKFFILLEGVCRDQSEVLVEENGKKVKKVQGDVEINFSSKWERNYNRKFPLGKWGDFWRKLYEHYIIYRQVQAYWGKLYSEMYELIDVAKAVLNAYK